MLAESKPVTEMKNIAKRIRNAELSIEYRDLKVLNENSKCQQSNSCNSKEC